MIAAANGRLALEAAQRRKPALVISDVVMPEMNGYELCSSIKADPQLSDVPVILVTTLSDPQDVIRGLECRADNFILKPYDADYLLGRVQFVLVNSQMRQSEQPGMGLEIFFNGQRHFITADRLQILNLLLSTYDAAIQRNRELSIDAGHAAPDERRAAAADARARRPRAPAHAGARAQQRGAAPGAAGGHPAGAAARARADGERHRARHQQCDLARSRSTPNRCSSASRT